MTTTVKTHTGSPDVETAIIGTGFAGLGMAINLQKAGKNNFVIFEREPEVGGTWWVNNYPGCACDVQSHLYSFSFEPNPNWSRMFSPQAEIQRYLASCADKYKLRSKIRFNTTVVGARFNDDNNLWEVKTEDGKTTTARIVVAAMGPLDRPIIPDIKGVGTFKGKTFHSQQWDHDYDLKGKKVAVIGTGASAIQFVPQIARDVEQLHLFQRTPPWIMPKPDRKVSKLEQFLFDKLPITQKLMRGGIYSFLEARVLAFVFNPKILRLAQTQAKRHIHKHIKDPELRAKVTPDYTMGCKRVLISDDYYPALAQDNVEVITDGVVEIRENSVVTADGSEMQVDAIIYGTGFHATDPLPAGMVFGQNGIDILDAWKDGIEAYKGCTVSGFPNLFIVPGPNTGLGHSSMVYMIESHIQFVMAAIKTMDKNKLATVNVRPEVQASYNEKIQARMKGTIWNTGGCQSWYMDENGKNTTLWPGFTFAYRRLTRQFDLENFEVQALQGSSKSKGKTTLAKAA